MEFLETWGVIVLLLLLGVIAIWKTLTMSRRRVKRTASLDPTRQRAIDVDRTIGSIITNSQPPLKIVDRSNSADGAQLDDDALNREVEKALRQLRKN